MESYAQFWIICIDFDYSLFFFVYVITITQYPDIIPRFHTVFVVATDNRHQMKSELGKMDYFLCDDKLERCDDLSCYICLTVNGTSFPKISGTEKGMTMKFLQNVVIYK